MSGADILAEVRAAIGELHDEVGDGTKPVCTIIRAGEPDYSTTPPTPGADVRYDASAAWEGSYSARDRDGTNITAQGIKIKAVPPFTNRDNASETTEPRNGDRLEWKGQSYSVVAIPRSAPSTVTFAYEIQARKS